MKIHITRDIQLTAFHLASGVNPIRIENSLFTILLQHQTLIIHENHDMVFKMNLLIHNNVLVLDRAETHIDHRRRGLGTLGLLLALFYAQHQGCKFGTLDTLIEPRAFGFWGGLQFGKRTPITRVLEELMIRISNISQSKQFIPLFLRETDTDLSTIQPTFLEIPNRRLPDNAPIRTLPRLTRKVSY